MIISWHDGGCYKVETPDFNLVLDPETSVKGGRLKADLILRTSVEISPSSGSSAEIVGPGEYEISSVKIRGFGLSQENEKKLRTVYLVILEGVRLVFLGEIETDLSEEILEDLGEVDILFVPANKKAVTYIKSIEPKIVIPGFGDPKKLGAELGREVEPREKLVIKKKDIEAEAGLKLVVLNP